MSKFPSKIFEHKIVIGVRDRVAESVDELFQSELFQDLLTHFLDRLEKKQSSLLDIFGHYPITPDDRKTLYDTLYYLTKLDSHLVPNIISGSEQLLKDRHALNEFVEQLYNYWRSFDRFIICDSASESFDKRPYRTFNSTVERLTNLVRQAYRDLQENITSQHPRVYRQVHAGAEVATIAVEPEPRFKDKYARLNDISIIRQVLIYPPLILEPPMNKRKGEFTEIWQNPIGVVDLDPRQWLCFPAKVGSLVFLVYFHETFYELGFALCNLFDLASDKDLKKMPDGVFLYGVDGESLKQYAEFPTVFYDDQANNLLVGAVPRGKEFGYFGYLKKMILTLHNLKIMQKGGMPFHGACVQISLKNGRQANVLLMGDTGAGKSESLEALRRLGDEYIKDLTIIADDMGSLVIHGSKPVTAYGTEIGAFLRLDDLQPGYAFGQLDRAIIMNASKTNARIVLPVTTYENITKGVPVDYIFYANNYESVDDDHPVIERFSTPEEAFHVFREGTVMSKGTTASTGLVHSYFANIFGPSQRKSIHDEIARKYFAHFFKHGIYVGQLRTRLGVSGFEIDGPRMAAEALLKVLLAESEN
jgi:hypothetical protein